MTRCSIDIIKPLSTALSSAFNKSQKNQEKNSWERRESNPGLLGEEQECYLCAMQPLMLEFFIAPLLPNSWRDTHLVEAEKTELLDDRPGRDGPGGGDFSGDLESNLDNLQRVGEHHLGGAGLARQDG